jgi:hypothetical protein
VTNSEKKIAKKITVNLHLDENIIDILKKDAKSKGVSLNARVNGILTKYVNFFQRTEEFEACIITSRQFAAFLEMMDEDRTAEIMKTDGVEANIAYLHHHNIPVTLNSIIDVCFEKLTPSAGVITKFSQYIDAEGYTCLVFDHRYGIKWSRIISRVFSYLLEETCNVRTSTTLLPNTIIIKIHRNGL